MKKRILLFTAIAGMATVMLTSGTGGAGHDKDYDCTGAETGLGNITGCSAGGCHGATATTGITVAIELDSNGTTPTTHYSPGKTYTVKITGTNTTSSSLPKFGFQVCCIKGSVSVATPVNAGSFVTTGLPSGVRHTAPNPGSFVCDFIEHGTPLAATSGSGGSGTTYVESFQWTAPVAGTGTVSFWGALLAANGTGTESGDHWNTTHVAINEWPVTGIVQTSNGLTIKAYPNPATDHMQLEMNNAETGMYTLQAFDMTGRVVASEQINVTGANHTVYISTGNWATGVYHILLQKDGFSKTIQVVKK